MFDFLSNARELIQGQSVLVREKVQRLECREEVHRPTEKGTVVPELNTEHDQCHSYYANEEGHAHLRISDLHPDCPRHSLTAEHEERPVQHVARREEGVKKGCCHECDPADRDEKVVNLFAPFPPHVQNNAVHRDKSKRKGYHVDECVEQPDQMCERKSDSKTQHRKQRCDPVHFFPPCFDAFAF